MMLVRYCNLTTTIAVLVEVLIKMKPTISLATALNTNHSTRKKWIQKCYLNQTLKEAFSSLLVMWSKLFDTMELMMINIFV